MRRLLLLLLGAGVLPSMLGAQGPADAPPDPAAYAVSYVEVLPSSRGAAVAAFRQYHDASRKDQGYAPFDLLERPDWAGHYAIVERWSDAKAFEAHGMSVHMKQFMDALQPIRISGYDQRPYKTLLFAPVSGTVPKEAIHVVTHVDVIPTLGDPRPLLRGFVEMSRREAGNLRFDALQNSVRPNHFTLVEIWRDQKALAAHAAAAHTRQYRDALQVIAGGPLDERLYKAAE